MALECYNGRLDPAYVLIRFTYLPRLKNRGVLVEAIQNAVSGTVPGPFAYAERWDEAKQTCIGLAIQQAGAVQVVIDSESVINQARGRRGPYSR